MQMKQSFWSESTGWMHGVNGTASHLLCDAHWVLMFGGGRQLQRQDLVQEVRSRYPTAILTGCSTAGEICAEQVSDDCLVVTAVQFDSTRVRLASVPLAGAEDSESAGAQLAQQLMAPDLRHIFVLSDGLNVNGTALAAGLNHHLPATVAVTGGLAGDGDRFAHTLIYCDDRPREKCVLGLGFYGDKIRIGHGSLGGWNSFGPQRLITKSQGNVLFELDGSCALDLYKTYLGKHAAELPASALRFPLLLQNDADGTSAVRTVLGIDESKKTMTFAGDVPEGCHVTLMNATVSRLIDGATGAAQAGLCGLTDQAPSLAILISCVGRRLVLKQQVEEETAAVRDVLGRDVVTTGFYSYGELCPLVGFNRCGLHNQTMTVTTLSES